jgi:ABC-2 type transport system ATP-binding protein
VPGPATPAAPVLVEHLTKRYRGVTVVDDISFRLEPGTVTGFVGPNGAGKSTTLRMILGLTGATAGQALIAGGHYADLSNPASVVGAVLESGDFHPARSGRDHLRVLSAQGRVPAARVEDVLSMVGLTDSARRAVRTYSLGMRQRLGLAGALLGGPTVLILDEPANGLDPAGVHWLRQQLRGFAAAGGTVLVSSHQLSELALTVDRVLILVAGRIVADTNIDTLQASGATLEDTYLRLTGEIVP